MHRHTKKASAASDPNEMPHKEIQPEMNINARFYEDMVILGRHSMRGVREVRAPKSM